MNSQADNRAQQVKAIFLESLDRMAGVERRSYLDQACGSDAALRHEVEALLLAHEKAGEFLDPAGFGAGLGRDQPALTEGPGTIIGRYKLLEKIGEGGMAVVYMAEQTEPLRRKVALKIIKLGMDTRQVIARFEAERQALALMDHPSIAKVLDAGATETGRPYFVMELVQGVSITEYCDQNSLSTKDRLHLFLQVCHAVQHAHQKGIIHRDIKPSNVMVTHHDGKPVPKVIDFGIAKATNQKLTEKTLFTRYAVGAGPRACPTPGGHRGPPLQEVRGDLDWIVMKSLEKDRNRRYETASGLAEDIRRHLESEPILARGPGAVYRLRKFLRRHRVQVLVSLTMAALIAVVAVVLSIWNQDRVQWNQDRLQLAEAERLQHEAILDRARDQYAQAQRDAALSTLQPLLQSPHVGPEAQLLRATILVDNRHPDEATTVLENLLGERREIAGAAHVLMVRVLRENGDLDAQKLQEIEQHRRQAANLLPKTAEAYFLQAMTALTVKEQLGALDEALRLDPKHYESRRLRAFTYYASRRYGPMSEDASVMEALRDRDPLGYSLHATALYELGRYKEAVAKYDGALAHTPKEDPQYPDLAARRLQAFLRMGDYGRVMAEAAKCLKSWPDKPVFQYHLFCALTARGENQKADAVFREIVRRTPTARNEFWFWTTKYVFDTLEAGQSWHPRGHEPTGAAFLPLVEAEETYRDLSAKGRRLVTNGFSAQWSPDGKKLAFSLGVHGYSGVALYDPATKETELLTVPGKDPRWSPDGRCIAFVRDCQALRLEELTTTERKEQTRRVRDEEVWVMNADGTEPRRLARGGWPSWGRDSAHVYYHSRLDSALYSISIMPEDATPRRIMACPSAFPSVSPDEQQVAYLEGTSLEVRDLASQALLTYWRVPFDTWGGPAWSPTGKEVCLGAGSSVGDRTGLWIYPLDSNEPAKVLTSQIMAASWAPDGAKLVFALRPPYFELWSADLDPVLSTVEALGPGQTLTDHWQDMFRLYTHRIETDRQDAYAYSDRARYYDYLHDRANANADIQRWSAVVSGQSPSDLRVRTSADLGRVVNMPFDCEVVFSAERPVCGMPTMFIAFGQKGRGNMRTFQIPLLSMLLLGLCPLSGLHTPAAHADFTLGEPVSVKHVIPALDGAYDQGISSCTLDGLEMYVQEAPGRPGGQGSFDLWVLKRDSVDADWGPLENLGPVVNSPAVDAYPAISADGLTLYFYAYAGRGGYGGEDLWMTTRATRNAPWGQAVNMGPKVNTPQTDAHPCVAPDNLELYFMSTRPGGYGGMDIYVCRRATASDPWGDPVNLGPVVNSAYHDAWPALSPDGLLLTFAGFPGSVRPDGYGGADLWMARRATVSSPWQTPVNIGPVVNSQAHDLSALISPDGSTLYLWSNRIAGQFVYQAPIIPTVDFNGDGKLDAKDLGLLADNWGKNTSLCDIGPFAWGDGVVDEKDLGVLMESLVTPKPKASDVPCDVTLSWISPSFANACDVYLGTSQEAVSTASRTNPQSVLVSKAQVGATYDPADPLKYSQTYYWRIDFVIPGTTPTIIKGPVLSFTTAAFAYPIKTITATASPSQVNMGPEKTIDGSGLDKSDGHSTSGTDMWLSTTAPHWIQYRFDKVYTLYELWVWNSNQPIESFIGFGAKTVKIEYSIDGTTWTPLANVPEFTKASGKPGYTANTIISFGGVPAKFVKLTIEKAWGSTPSAGLSEVRFFAIQSAAAKP